MLAQDCEFEYEIIVIDDASTDRSVEVIKTFLSDDRVRLMALEENLGAAAAINLGWREARGSIFAGLMEMMPGTRNIYEWRRMYLTGMQMWCWCIQT